MLDPMLLVWIIMGVLSIPISMAVGAAWKWWMRRHPPPDRF